MRAFVLDGYGAIADHVRLAEIADPVPGPDDVLIEIHAASLNPIDFKLAHGDLKRVSKYQLPRPFGFDASRLRAVGGRRPRGSSRATRSLCAPRARPSARLPKRSRLAKIRRAQAGFNFTRGSSFAAACRADHGADVRACRREVRAADPDPCRLRRVGTFAVQYAKHLGLHVTIDDEFEKCGFRQLRSAPTGSSPTTARTIFEQDGNYDIVYDTLGGAFTVDAFKVVKRGGVVISLSGPPDRDFARREGAGLLVGIVVWLMGRKVYAASAAPGRDLLLVLHGIQRRPIARDRRAGRRRRDQAGDRSRICLRAIAGRALLPRSRPGARQGGVEGEVTTNRSPAQSRGRGGRSPALSGAPSGGSCRSARRNRCRRRYRRSSARRHSPAACG